ncbi:MAG TPA: hypothetical protein DCS07_12875 [Bdellovibrionales bacterium]|nr:MAG: hypothetical protein A2Z97_13755 [Bdellovibrionales bacterium GWB1_52_6]OFZ06174.1 MAG: hypothetical protein A2X97_08970 [Bdellovibrionales bacterium GWA1_52_35]OFZ40168.1 MAG: hypothetical protein A2070_02400 [Bdellovibrionales bacterium GWC1_52_8]HAR43505.1 hypothetical protein [Bdellovibrionales bacterium]HCM41184.1 hypothetical protein [Bdellovibrionales bacterium]
MKSNTSNFFIIAIALCLISGPQALSREKARNKAQEAGKTASASAETAPATPSEPKRMAVGLASSDQLTRASSLTGIIELDSKNLIQGYLAIPGSSPLQFSLAGIYKHTVIEQGTAGLHVGGGLAFGIAPKSAAVLVGDAVAEAFGGAAGSDSTTAFFVRLGGVGGIHLPFPGTSNVMIHLDAGPVLNLQSDANDFNIGAFSGLLGASVVYYL